MVIILSLHHSDDLVSDLDNALVHSVPEPQVRHDAHSITASTR
jgi:hypothetical protein